MRFTFRHAIAAAAAGVLVSLAGTQVASAALLSFDYSATYGATSIAASGTLSTADVANADGSFTVIGISGTRTVSADTQTITGIANGGNFTFDNKIFLDTSLNSGRFFNVFGLLFTTSSALSGIHTVNVFDNFNGAYGNPAGYGESSSPANPAFYPVAYVSRLSIVPVPEPSTIGLLGLGLLAIAATRRRAR